MAKDHRRISEEVARGILLDDPTLFEETRLVPGIQPGLGRVGYSVTGFGVIT